MDHTLEDHFSPIDLDLLAYYELKERYMDDDSDKNTNQQKGCCGCFSSKNKDKKVSGKNVNNAQYTENGETEKLNKNTERQPTFQSVNDGEPTLVKNFRVTTDLSDMFKKN